MSPLFLFLKIFNFCYQHLDLNFFLLFLFLISAVAQLAGFGLIFVLINYLKNQALSFGDYNFNIIRKIKFSFG